MLSQQEAEEATQDTFVKLYRSIGQYRQDAKLSTWIYSIAYRTGLDYLRKRPNHQSLQDSAYQVPDDSMMDDQSNKDLGRWLDLQLSKLPPEEVALLRLYYLQELQIKEVAEITGLTVANVKVKLFRIRKSLKDQMSHLKLSDIIN